jgi:hypothetical protein
MSSLPNARKAAKEINGIPGIQKYLTASESGHGKLARVELVPSKALRAHQLTRAHLADLHVLRGLVDFTKSKKRKTKK